jgi:inner membrane protein
MCSPVGHGLAAYTLSWRQSRAMRFNPAVWLPAMWILSLLPDFDFIPGLIVGHPNLYHHGWTHSLVFCAGVAAVIAACLALSGKPYALKAGGVCLLVLISHLALDCLSKDRMPPYGLQVFWPFSDRYVISPVTVFLDVNKGLNNRTFAIRLFTLHNARTILVETCILGPLAAWTWFSSRRRGGKGGP